MRHGKRDRFSPPFAAIEKRIWLKDEEWRQFSPKARDLYALLKCAFNGHNNGDIQLFYSKIRGIKGLNSPKGISRAFKELTQAGWIQVTWAGGLYRLPNKYRLTGKSDKML